MQFIFYVGHSFLITASLFFNWVILLWGSNLSTHIKFLWEPTFLSMSLSMSVLLAQISASGSAEATFRVEEMVFPDMLKASFLSVSQLPEAKSCTEAAQPLLLLDLNLWRFEGGVYGKLKMRLVDLWAPWQKYYHYLTGILSLPDVSELSKVEMNFLTILEEIVILSNLTDLNFRTLFVICQNLQKLSFWIHIKIFLTCVHI